MNTTAAPLLPSPDIWGSTTPMANAVATAASTAFPPARRTSRPASLARPFAEVTTPFFASTRFSSSARAVVNAPAGATGRWALRGTNVAAPMAATTSTGRIDPNRQAIRMQHLLDWQTHPTADSIELWQR